MRYKPTWSEHEKGIQSDDAKVASESAELFDDERAKETQSSKKTRDWEKDRKKKWQKDKSTYVKSKRKQEQKDSTLDTKKIIDGGSITRSIKPARGYLLIKITQLEQTESGIILPEDDLQNIAEILAVGDDLILDKYILPTPVKVGDKVLLKKGAGMDLNVKGTANKLCLFTDVLGVLEV